MKTSEALKFWFIVNCTMAGPLFFKMRAFDGMATVAAIYAASSVIVKVIREVRQ